MKPFTTVTSITAPMYRPNIDTDTIIPSRHIKSVSREGLGEGAFAGWRYLATGDTDTSSLSPNPNFVLNQPVFQNAAILLAGDNFGCGSSREAAVWALEQIGIRCVIAPSFGTIFKANCIANGLLPVELPAEIVQDLASLATNGNLALTVDLKTCTVIRMSEKSWPFTIEASARLRLLEGLDEIGLTLLEADVIHAFQVADRQNRPWVWLDKKISTGEVT
jgi:3-isopropylmalate/(R)-2-methylmalate dehydratase small subunit